MRAMPSNRGTRLKGPSGWMIAGAALASWLVCGAMGQSSATPSGAAGAEQPIEERVGGRDEAAEAAQLREQLRTRIEMLKQAQARLERASTDLESGATPVRVRQELERDLRPMLREVIGLRWRDGALVRGRGEGDRLPMRGPDGVGPPPPQPGDRGRIIEFIERENPALAEQLRAARRENPEAADRIVDRLGLQVRQVLAERDPATRELRLRDVRNGWALLAAQRALTEAYRTGAPEAEVRERTARLRELLEQRYDLQLEVVSADIASLEQRLSRLREEAVERSAEGKAAFVDERLERSVSSAREAATRSGRGTPAEGEGRRGPEGRGPSQRGPGERAPR